MVSSSIFMLLVYSSFFKIFQVQGSDCIIRWRPASRTFHPPLILVEKKLSREYDISLPEIIKKRGVDFKVIRVPRDRKVTFSCPGGKNENKLIKFPDSEKGGVSGIEAECNIAGVLKMNGKDQDQMLMNDMSCKNAIVDSTEKYDSTNGYVKCHNAKFQPIGDLIKIGFYSYGGYYYSQIEVCFNTNLKTTLWTRHTLHGFNYAAHSSDRISHWTPDALYGSNEPNRPSSDKKWDDIYKGTYQKKLLKDELNRDLVFPSGSPRPPNIFQTGLFMAKGHLSANADFVTSAERGATFHYINALPQWQANNNGNWKNIVEESVQNLAGKKKTDLIIISGGHGTLMLESQKTSKPKMEEIYLIKTTKVVPVPELFWKVVYDPSTDEAVSFVVTNNPYMKANPDIMCKDKKGNTNDVCNQLDPTWFNTGKNSAIHDKPKGYTYCCEVEELMKNIPNIPTGYTGRNLLGRKQKRPRPPGT